MWLYFIEAGGGICSRYKAYTINKKTQKQSRNTGFVTLKNGQRMPYRMNFLTLAHEIGHSFGSKVCELMFCAELHRNEFQLIGAVGQRKNIEHILVGGSSL